MCKQSWSHLTNLTLASQILQDVWRITDRARRNRYRQTEPVMQTVRVYSFFFFLTESDQLGELSKRCFVFVKQLNSVLQHHVRENCLCGEEALTWFYLFGWSWCKRIYRKISNLAYCLCLVFLRMVPADRRKEYLRDSVCYRVLDRVYYSLLERESQS